MPVVEGTSARWTTWAKRWRKVNPDRPAAALSRVERLQSLHARAAFWQASSKAAPEGLPPPSACLRCGLNTYIVGVKDAIIECTAMLQRHFMQFAKNVMPRKRCVMRAKCNPSPGQMAMRHFCRAAENIATTKIVWKFRVRQVQGLSTRH